MNGIGMFIESVVAILLMLTIGYCMMLNRRLKLLKADEDTLRGTIAELITATEIAERAIAGLKITARDCEIGLGERLNRADRVCAELDRKLAAGKGMIAGLSKTAAAGRLTESAGRSTEAAGMPADEPPPPANDPHAIAAAAQAFAERLRTKVFGLAA